MNGRENGKLLLIVIKINRQNKFFSYENCLNQRILNYYSLRYVLFFIPLKSTFHSFRWKTKLYTSYRGRIQKEGIGINVIKSLNNVLPWQALLMTCKSFIRPRFDYWYIIYDQPNKESLCQTTLKFRRWLCMLHMQNSFKREIILTIND